MYRICTGAIEHDGILYKGLEDPWILVSAGDQEVIPNGFCEVTVVIVLYSIHGT